MNKKKWIAVGVVLVLIVAGLVGYLGLSGRDSSGPSEDGTAKLNDLQITINGAFFESNQITKQVWLIIETNVQNGGEEVEYFLFGQASRFYLQDSGGKTYATFNAHEDVWAKAKGKIALTEMKVYPGESKTLTLQFFNVPEGATGLKLFCRISAVEEGKKISIPFTPAKSAPVPTSTPKTTPPSSVTPEPTKTEPQPTINIVKGSPGEVAVSFYTLLSEKKYTEAEKKVDPDELKFIQSRGGLEKISEYFSGRTVVSIKVTKEEIKDSYAYVDIVISLSDGSQEEVKGMKLEKIGQEWKLTG